MDTIASHEMVQQNNRPILSIGQSAHFLAKNLELVEPARSDPLEKGYPRAEQGDHRLEGDLSSVITGPPFITDS